MFGGQRRSRRLAVWAACGAPVLVPSTARGPSSRRPIPHLMTRPGRTRLRREPCRSRRRNGSTEVCTDLCTGLLGEGTPGETHQHSAPEVLTVRRGWRRGRNRTRHPETCVAWLITQLRQIYSVQDLVTWTRCRHRRTPCPLGCHRPLMASRARHCATIACWRAAQAGRWP